MALWRTRIISALIILALTLVISFFINSENRILAITNTTFFVGLLLLMISTLLFISVNWIFKVFTYHKTVNSGMDPALDYSASSEKDLSGSNEKNHHNYGVNYEIDPEVIREREEYVIKQKNREKQIYAIPLTASIVLILVSVLFNFLYYM